METIKSKYGLDVLETSFTISPERGSHLHKTIKLRIHVGNLPSTAVDEALIYKHRIAWQNNNRDSFDKLSEDVTYDYTPGAGRRQTIVREMTPDEIVEYLRKHPELIPKAQNH